MRLLAPSFLTCNREITPLGVDDPTPRFDWRSFTATKTYQVLVTNRLGLMWDSGWNTSPHNFAVYAGPSLEPFTRYQFQVRVRDGQGVASPFSELSWFETGAQPRRSWDSEWLQLPGHASSRGDLFLREIRLEKPVTAARAYIAGLGYFQLRVNGKRVGRRVLDPAWTSYSQKVCYVAHDITEFLTTETNVVAVMVGTGRYRQPVVNAWLRFEHLDGTVTEDKSNHRTWWSAESPVTRASLFDGETYDARVRMGGWDPLPLDSAGSDALRLKRPMRAEGPGGVLTSQDVEPMEVVEDRTAVSVREFPSSPLLRVVDFGQNFAGWIKVDLRAPQGTVVRFLYSEALEPSGRVNMKMNRFAQATDEYIARGEGVEVWEPSFTYHGFRYVQIETSAPVEHLEVVGRVVRTAARKTGTFHCSDEMVNRLRLACEWTEMSNFHSVPTDCPQREERMGWLNDMTVRAECALYTLDLHRLYAKWSEDIAHAQGSETGAITDVAPFDPFHSRPFGNRPADPLCSSYLLTVWLSYLHFGDTTTLERRFEGLVRWQDYLWDHSTEGLMAYSEWGDWAGPEAFTIPWGDGSLGAWSSVTPGDLVSTCFVGFNAKLLSQMAQVLGKREIQSKFEQQAQVVQRAFHSHYWKEGLEAYGTGSQACQAIPLALGLVEPEYQARAAAALARGVQAQEYHLTTGNLGTRYVLEALADHGYIDLAWALVTQTTYPSWGFMLENGATTIWERWELLLDNGMNSHNHPMNATVSGWLSKYLGGIRPVEACPGFTQIVIRPFVPNSLQWVESSLETLSGKIRSSWRRNAAGEVEYEVDIPSSATARLELPGRGRRLDGEACVELVRREDGWRQVWHLAGGQHRITLAAEI